VVVWAAFLFTVDAAAPPFSLTHTAPSPAAPHSAVLCCAAAAAAAAAVLYCAAAAATAAATITTAIAATAAAACACTDHPLPCQFKSVCAAPAFALPVVTKTTAQTLQNPGSSGGIHTQCLHTQTHITGVWSKLCVLFCFYPDD
jgi:hypothetical protein